LGLIRDTRSNEGSFHVDQLDLEHGLKARTKIKQSYVLERKSEREIKKVPGH